MEKFDKSENCCIAITPEGTRSPVSQWRTGFLHISKGANVPILLGKFDFNQKIISVEAVFSPTGNIDEDMQSIKNYYRDAVACYPEKFCID